MRGDKKPILSICIPTWNRWYSLQYTLKSIIEQDEFKSGDLEIVISDNASTDETETEIKKICKKYSNIIYFRNKENIGSNPNINKVLSLGKGEYLWILGSDSLISKGGIYDVLNVINKNKPDIIYNTCYSVKDFKHLSDNYDKEQNIYSFKDTRGFLTYISSQYNYDPKSFMHLECLITYISCICISSEFYRNSLNNIFKEISDHKFNKNYFSQELICFSQNANNGIVIINNYSLKRYKTKKTTYFVSLSIIKDFKSLCKFIKKKYNIGKEFNNFYVQSKLFWYKSYFIGKVVRFLIKFHLYRITVYYYRKFRNIKNNEYIDEIDQLI